MLDVRRLRLLHELRTRGTLAAVAESLNFSPSAVSQQLTLLEEEAGVPLLRRVGRGVQLTPQAEVLARRTAEILDTLERAEAELLASLTEVRGTVRVAVFQSAALALMPPTLSRIHDEHPEVRLEMTQHEPETGLRETWARGFDMVVAEQYPLHAAPHHPGVDRELLTSDAIRLAVPRGMVATRGVTSPADVGDLPWVMEPRGAASRHWAEQACRRDGFEPDVRFETADLQAQMTLVESGNAVALLPDLIWARHPPRCDLVTLPGSPRRQVFTSVRDSSRRHPAVAVVRRILHEVATSLDLGLPAA